MSRKAVERSPEPSGEPLEASFPLPEAFPAEPTSQPVAGSSSAWAALAKASLPAPAAWSSEDESSFQALLARRKAAGYQRRGRDLSTQLLKPGTIKTNPDTVVATIVALVAERGELSRGELLATMAEANFPHPRARPKDTGWCQGYVAGAIRNGFLAVTAEPSADAQEG
jgi:hypothetical protein